MIYLFLSTITNEEQRNAIEQLFIRHYTKMVGVANNILHNMSDAEDAVMEAFKNICKIPDRFVEYESKEVIHLAFLYVQGAARTIYRNNRTRNKYVGPLDVEEEGSELEKIADPDQDLDHVLINDHNRKIICDAIASLSLDYRLIVIMRYYYCLRIADIADAVGLNITTVTNRLFRARQKIMEFAVKRGIIYA